MGLENTFWKWLKAGWRGTPRLTVDRIENLVGSGMADTYGMCNGHAFYAELKACARPVFETSLLLFKMRTEQIIWLQEWWSCGASAYILIRVGIEHKSKVYMIPGEYANQLVRCTEPDLRQLTVIYPEAKPAAILRKLLTHREPFYQHRHFS